MQAGYGRRSSFVRLTLAMFHVPEHLCFFTSFSLKSHFFSLTLSPKETGNSKDMEKKELKRLPVGIQTFSKIKELDCLYIDKTEYIWNYCCPLNMKSQFEPIVVQ